ncbi:MAG: NAD-dependent epimerase/dehydratase family protein [Bacteroidetes bacterium]|nr:NAD-dependent epimerase/dehydratase family protein [Bacteroidota bacterium]
MTDKPVVVISGAGGEIGHGLIQRIAAEGNYSILALDLRPLDPDLAKLCAETVEGSILDTALLEALASKYRVAGIFHLAAMLSTSGEAKPELAHAVNVQGTLNLLTFANREANNAGANVRFLFPSSIAVYGAPSISAKEAAGRITEEQFLMPTTMYGVNKLSCEHLGRYYTHHYRQLSSDRDPFHVDFRSIRFPGLISAFTVPSGGTSDYAPEMLHAAAKGEPYACFARPDTRIPFMAMPDAIDALMKLFEAPAEALTTTAYNVGAFSPSAEEVRLKTLEAFPGAEITYQNDVKRQGILDTWPADVDDSRARADWGWAPQYDFDRSFNEYLIPNIARRYALSGTTS